MFTNDKNTRWTMIATLYNSVSRKQKKRKCFSLVVLVFGIITSIKGGTNLLRRRRSGKWEIKIWSNKKWDITDHARDTTFSLTIFQCCSDQLPTRYFTTVINFTVLVNLQFVYIRLYNTIEVRLDISWGCADIYGEGVCIMRRSI